MIKIDAKAIIKKHTDVDIEPDQRLQIVFERGFVNMHKSYTDLGLFISALKTNPSFIRIACIDNDFMEEAEQYYGDGFTCFRPATQVEGELGLAVTAKSILQRAVSKIKSGQKTLSINDFFSSLVQHSVEIDAGWLRDAIARILHKNPNKRYEDSPKAQSFLHRLNESVNKSEDFSYIISLNEDKICFRVTSVLDDYLLESPTSGIIRPQRAILTHFKDRFGGFSEDEIQELEQLLNTPSAKEQDYQRFFERNAHFFRKWDYREIYPQVTLRRLEGGLIPDFILTDKELQKAAIVELKSPSSKLVRRQNNRDRFASCVMEARYQLLKYNHWFREKHNREYLKSVLGMEIYEPHLVVVIGRSHDFIDEYDRQYISSSLSDIEVVTYDDIFRFANNRKVFLEQPL